MFVESTTITAGKTKINRFYDHVFDQQYQFHELTNLIIFDNTIRKSAMLMFSLNELLMYCTFSKITIQHTW